MKTALTVLACLATWFVASHVIAAACVVVRRMRDKAKMRRQVQEWRRERYRAPIVKVGTLCNGLPMPDWFFYLPPGEFVTIQARDPLTGDMILFGYSLAELAEIARTPSEFERPELADWPASE